MTTSVLRSSTVGKFAVELLFLDDERIELHARDPVGNSLSGTPAQMAQLALEILHVTRDQTEIR